MKRYIDILPYEGANGKDEGDYWRTIFGFKGMWSAKTAALWWEKMAYIDVMFAL